MGNKSGKLDVAEAMAMSSSGRGVREGLATWHRQGVEVTDVYEIEGVLGSGLMGEVYKVKRRQEARGTHNSKTRAAAAAAAVEDKDGKSGSKDNSKAVKRMMSKAVSKKIGGGNKEKKDPIAEAAAAADHPEPKLPPSPHLPKPKGILRTPTRGAPAPATRAESEDDDVSVSSVATDSSLTHSQRQRRKHSKRTIRFAREYACKTVSTARVKTGQLAELLNEIYVMRTLDHPYILRLYEVYQVKRKIWLITEYCSGGDLTSRKMEEARVTVVLEQILRAVSYMHRRGILHRDLKLENIMFESGAKDARIRLIDFGLSKTFDRAVQGRKAIGTAYTLSPEIAKNENAEYTEKTEMWSIGVIAWILLAGDFPFLKEEKDLSDKGKLDKLLKANYSFGITWRGRGITESAKDFVRKCLKLKPEDRWTPKEALEYVQNTWMQALEEEADKYEDKESKRVLEMATGPEQHRERKLSTDMDALGIGTEDIEAFCKAGLLKKTILTTLAHTMDREDVAHLREVFLMADTEETGTISLLELKEAFRKLDTNVDDETLERMFHGIDQDKSGQIHYAEFLAALAESQGLVTMERLAEAFDRIDSDGKGYISHDDLKEVLGDDYDKDLVDEMIQEADFKKNGQVDYEEFLELMFGDPGTGFAAAGDVSSSLGRNLRFRDITDSLRSTDSIRGLLATNSKDEIDKDETHGKDEQ